jgi:hypothetical protein
MQTDAQGTTHIDAGTTRDDAATPSLPLWTRVSDFVLKRLFGYIDDGALSVEERERQLWDKQW